MERKNNFQELIKPDGYQVFLFVCPASIPANFALHPWFVCVKHGKVSRYEVRFGKNKNNPAMGRHFHFNFLPPFSGIEKFTFMPKRFFWKNVKLLGSIEGSENSLAKEVYGFINRSIDNYPYRDKYRLWSPNSNTYVQWALSHFPNFKAPLPWNCFGKNYGIKINAVNK